MEAKNLPEAVLHPASIIAELKKNRISHVVWLPDSETNFMYQQLTSDPDLELIPVCREGTPRMINIRLGRITQLGGSGSCGV